MSPHLRPHRRAKNRLGKESDPTMHAIKRILFLTLSALVGGCAFHHAPYPMYEGESPLADTAVFSSLDERATQHEVATIRSVDGKDTPRSVFPVWVRVLPGTHHFTVHYSTNYGIGAGAITYKYAELPVTVVDMKPRHVYVARFGRTAQGVSVSVEDLGERPRYGIHTGGGVNPKYHPVEF